MNIYSMHDYFFFWIFFCYSSYPNAIHLDYSRVTLIKAFIYPCAYDPGFNLGLGARCCVRPNFCRSLYRSIVALSIAL